MSEAADRFFITGCPRSGTTLLSVAVDRHSRLCVPPETGFYDEIAPKLPPHGGERLIALLVQWRRLPELGVSARNVAARIGDAPPTPASVLGAILDLHALARGKARSGEKTPQHLLHVPAIVRDFPGAKIICVVRDARDNALSLQAMPWWTGTLRGAARFWVRCARLATRFQREHPERFLRIRFEDFIASPAEVLGRVMEHLGETLEPAQLDPTMPSATVLDRSLPWKGRALTAIDAGEAGRRRNAARASEIALIESIASRELRAHGYEAPAPRSLLARFVRR